MTLAQSHSRLLDAKLVETDDRGQFKSNKQIKKELVETGLAHRKVRLRYTKTKMAREQNGYKEFTQGICEDFEDGHMELEEDIRPDVAENRRRIQMQQLCFLTHLVATFIMGK